MEAPTTSCDDTLLHTYVQGDIDRLSSAEIMNKHDQGFSANVFRSVCRIWRHCEPLIISLDIESTGATLNRQRQIPQFNCIPTAYSAHGVYNVGALHLPHLLSFHLRRFRELEYPIRHSKSRLENDIRNSGEESVIVQKSNVWCTHVFK
jgi:hypothetical protein